MRSIATIILVLLAEIVLILLMLALTQVITIGEGIGVKVILTLLFWSVYAGGMVAVYRFVGSLMHR